MENVNYSVEYLQNPASTLISFAISLATIIAAWRIYVKMGEEGWICLIPFYNKYVLFKKCWEKSFFFYYLLSILIGFFTLAVCIAGAAAGNRPIAVTVGVLSGLVWAAALVLGIMLKYRISRAFGHGTAFTIGYVLMPSIFTMILGFGQDTYKVGYLS